MRNAMAYAGKTQRRIVAAWIGTAFAQDDAEAARTQWRQVADQLRPRVKKLAELMDEAESDVLAKLAGIEVARVGGSRLGHHAPGADGQEQKSERFKGSRNHRVNYSAAGMR